MNDVMTKLTAEPEQRAPRLNCRSLLGSRPENASLCVSHAHYGDIHRHNVETHWLLGTAWKASLRRTFPSAK